MKKFLLAAAFTAIAGTAWAGPQYIDGTGYAVSGYDVVAYFSLEQNPVGQAQPHGVKGNTSYVSEYNGSKFAFSTKANKEAFDANPAKYAPQYDGHCAYGVAQGGKVPGNPDLWRIRDGKLYLNITKNVVGFWEKDIPGNLKLSSSKWGGLESAAASDRVIPQFTSAAPVAN